METLLAEFYVASMICGAISVMITIFGGWFLIKGLKSLQSEQSDDE